MKNTPLTKIRGAVLYTRVSGDDQDKHGTSPETQRDMTRAKALAMNLPIVEEHYDGGISGAFLLSRPGMQAALATIREGRADTLICPNISRFSRDVEHQQAIKKAVKAAGGTLVFCDMDFADTPEGDLNFDIHGSFAAYERKSIAARTERGRRKRASEGLQPARSRAPYGYEIVGKEDVLRGLYPADMRGKYLILEPEAETIRSLFERYASGTHTLSGLARWLNAEGIPTKRKGSTWAMTSLHSILSHPVYKGEASYGRHEHTRDDARPGQINPHTGRPLKTVHQQKKAEPGTYLTWAVPAIVSDELWDAVQARFRQNVAGCSGNPKRLRMLAGRITCPTCSGGMTVYQRGSRKKNGAPEPSHVLFQCSRFRWAKQNTGADACDRTVYRIDIVEGAVLTCLEDAATNPASVCAARAAAAAFQAKNVDQKKAENKDADPAKQLAAIDAELSKLAKRQETTVKAQIAGMEAGADASAYLAIFGQLRQERTALEAQRTELTQLLAGSQPAVQPSRPAPKFRRKEAGEYDFPSLLDKVRSVLTSDEVDGATKREIIGRVIERVYPEKEGARIVFLPGLFDEANRERHGSDTLQPYT